MESLETQQKTIRLGRELVASLGDEQSNDVLCRWMACYLAEQLNVAETASGKAKSIAREKSFNTILTLWKHRASLPNEQRPFENFDSVFRALERLDPDEPRGYYYAFRESHAKPEPNSIEATLAFIVNVDGSARVLIELALAEAIEKATDEKTRLMLQNAVPTGADRDIKAIQALVQLRDGLEPGSEAGLRKIKETYERRLRTFNQFEKTCKAVRVALEKRLKILTKKERETQQNLKFGK